MKVITRKILHPDLIVRYKVYQLETDKSYTSETIDRKSLCIDIAKAKTYLVKEKRFQKGDKVVLATTHWPEYLVWFFAVSELGGAFVISDSPSLFNSTLIDYRLSLYSKIDHFIFYHNEHSSFESLKEVYINQSSYKDYHIDRKIDKRVTCQPGDIILYSTSSGTTNKPKVIAHNHNFFYELIDRNAKIFNLKSKDRCLHTKNLHHGSVLGVYFLPTIKHCRFHFWQNMIMEDGWMQDFLDYVKRFNITRCLIFSNSHLKSINLHLQPSHSKFTIKFNILSAFCLSDIDNIIRNCKHEIISVFGCTETSGPLFLLRLDNSNYTTKNFKNFGKPLDNFYEISLDNESILSVKTPDGDIISTGDQFNLINQEYIHVRRISGLKISDTPIYLDLLSNVIDKFKINGRTLKNGSEYDLISDKLYSKIYMRCNFDIDLEKLNDFIIDQLKTTAYNICTVLVDQREKYLGGIKLDAEKLRIVCRNLIDKTQ